MTAVKVVNSIRARTLDHRLLKVLYQEMGAEYEILLYYTEVRWLLREKVCIKRERLYEFRKKFLIF